MTFIQQIVLRNENRGFGAMGIPAGIISGLKQD
jgi:hypothetical protein